MPWTQHDFPDSMKNLPKDVRDKAIEIANALLEDRHMEEGIAIATAISRAKDWAANRGHKTETATSRTVDVKDHGHDVYVIPYAGQKWAIKTEGSERVGKIFDYKRAAVSEARKTAHSHKGTLTIQLKTGRVEKRISYNPRKRV